MIGLILSNLFGIGKDYIKQRAEQKAADHKVKIAEKENRARLLLDKQSNNHAWEMASLTDKDRFLRRFSFFMFSMPFIVAMIKPEWVKNYFDVALNSMPDWYIQIFVAIVGGVWGIAEFKNALPAIIGAFKK